jgi:hypothetical protein
LAPFDANGHLDRHQTLILETGALFKRRSSIGLGLFLLAGVVAWWTLRSSAVPPQTPGPRLPSAASAPLAQSAKVPVNFSPDGVPIRPAGSAEVDAVGMLPHPITPQHERIFRENNLIGQLNGAMDVKDAAGLRKLLRQYRDEYPEDAHVLQDGYELIANCLERPRPEARAAAQRYYDTQLDSGLRRYIRRHCLE